MPSAFDAARRIFARIWFFHGESVAIHKSLVGHREVKDFVLSLLKARRTNFPSPGTCRTKRVVSTLAYQRGVCDEDVATVHFLKKRGVGTWYKNFVNLLRHGSAAFWFIWGKINEKRT